jgi:hypothetical protein
MDIVLSQVEHENEVFEVIISSTNLTINKSEIVNSLGYSSDKIPVPFDEMVDSVISKVSQSCEIKAGYRLVKIKKHAERSDGLYVGDRFFKMQKIVTGQLKKAEQAALFVCTIGPAMEAWAKQLLGSGDPTMGYIVDAVASKTVESATDVLHDHIGRCMQEHGLNITNRYSPGYCDWSVSEQHLLFSLLPENFCGIILTESALMVPIKSVSGIIGIGGAVKRVDYICDRCGMKDCNYRAFRLTSNRHNRSKKLHMKHR